MPADATVATLPLGYADGVTRSLWKEGRVLVGGKPRRFFGVVTMDASLVTVGDDDVKVRHCRPARLCCWP